MRIAFNGHGIQNNVEHMNNEDKEKRDRIKYLNFVIGGKNFTKNISKCLYSIPFI